MSNTNLSLAALVGSRICHDLISPVGAINNGLELLQMSAPDDSPELDLIAQSVNSANARVRLFRVAFGVASVAQKLGAPEVAGILSGVYDDARHDVRYDATGDVPRAEVQAAFLAVLCCETALPVGGTITVREESGTWSITAAGGRVDWDPALWGPLSSGRAPDAPSPSQVQFAMLPICLDDLHRRIDVQHDAETLTLRF
ncbi:MAG: histidine phosphotransferase [Rhodobacterales bacterium]|nr:MAG: histidine phosphotransferase [Rhodobacterales bacterium]